MKGEMAGGEWQVAVTMANPERRTAPWPGRWHLLTNYGPTHKSMMKAGQHNCRQHRVDM